MGTSIKDLARIANVSTTTVLRALKNKPDISEVTRLRILDLAEKHQYRPNFLARGLVTSRTFTIGIIVPDITNPFFPDMIKGAESMFWEAGYNVILANTDYNSQKEALVISEMISRQVDGIIISPTIVNGDSDWWQSAYDNGLPVVSVTRMENADIDTVIADDRKAGELAANHLLAYGRKKILYLGNNSGVWANKERLAGLVEAHRMNGMTIPPERVQSVDHGTIENSYGMVAKLISSGLSFDAIITFDDLMAIGAKMAIVESGLRVPEDIALVGFDNIQLSALPDINLTTIDIPKKMIGTRASSLLLGKISEGKKNDGSFPSAKEIILKPELIVRRSCGSKI